ncbi:MAG: Zn-dependent exopeptidase M28 [bacterium]|nr:MAG: Zn-dependent exopeptidase M28 [bacterium]
MIPIAAMVIGLYQHVAVGEGGGASGTGAQQPAAQVSRDSLESMIRFLSIDPGTDQLRSRFVLREAELGEVADSLAQRLERYLDSPVDHLFFTVHDSDSVYSNDSTFTAENIVARLEGSGQSSGVMLLTAHYDATGIHSTDIGWKYRWNELPAPGADDNGTGVAALMEAARVLERYTLPFDIIFVLFSAEEIGKLGSEDFVERFETLYGETILGVINIDMIGYLVDDMPGGDIISNYRSGWLVDLVLEAAERIDPDLALGVIKPGPSNYDHGPFWEHGFAAVTVAEPLEGAGFIVNPYYHTVDDVIEHVDMDQVYRITRVLVDFLFGFALERASDMALLPSDILLLEDGYVTQKLVYEPGEILTILVRVRNVGSTSAPPWTDINLVVSIETADGGRTVYDDILPPPAPLEAAGVEIPVVIDERYRGAGTIAASITVTGCDDDTGNNRMELSIGVHREESTLISHSIQPNPVRASFRDASFCINLASEVDCAVEVYTLEGERIGTAYVGPNYGIPLEIGLNCFECGDLFPEAGDLVSGIYLYHIRLFGPGGGSMDVTGMFAVAN